MILVNGRKTDRVSVLDRGLQYGDGLFETLRISEAGTCDLWPWHMSRLAAGCRRLGMPVPDPETCLAEIRSAVDGQPAVVRLTVTRGEGPRGYAPPETAAPTRIVQAGPLPTPAGGPVEVMLCETRLGRNPHLGGLKHLSRLENVLAAAEVRDAGFSEGLVRDCQGRLVEAISANLFLLHQGRCVTPDVAAVGVAGVYRAWLRERVPIEVAELTVADLERADGVFLANAVAGVRTVRSVAGLREFSGAAVDAFVESAGSPWSAR